MTPAEDLFAFLRFASISTDPGSKGQVDACADWVAGKLRGMGLETTVHDTPGHPIVVGRNEPRPGRPTVLIYGHYDVQPPDPLDQWEHPPFEPQVRDGIVTARGCADNKGQILSHILGVEQALAEDGDLPVNLILLVEGEEEIGSPNLTPFLEAHREELACDLILVSDTIMVADGWPTLTYGLRGITALEVILRGPARDLHSGFYGGVVKNPLTAMAQLLATLHNPDATVAIEGFYDRVRPVEDWEAKLWATLPFSAEKFIDESGVPELVIEPGVSPAAAVSARPTAEINGMYGGYQGQGVKTVIPTHAVAKLSFRLVPDQEPEEIALLVSAHLEKHLPTGVTMEVIPGHGGRPYLADPQTPHAKAVRAALQELTPGREPALVREGGSIPIVNDFKRILGADTLLIGLASPGCGMHSPNEKFPLANLDYGIAMNRKVLQAIGAL